MKHKLTLDYTLAEGWFTPWVEGLRRGEAVASWCPTCELAQFPPLRRCPNCQGQSQEWITLPGRAQILFRSTGADGDVALAQFEGAQSACVVHCANLPETAMHGRLRASSDGPPKVVLEPESSP